MCWVAVLAIRRAREEHFLWTCSEFIYVQVLFIIESCCVYVKLWQHCLYTPLYSHICLPVLRGSKSLVFTHEIKPEQRHWMRAENDRRGREAIWSYRLYREYSTHVSWLCCLFPSISVLAVFMSVQVFFCRFTCFVPVRAVLVGSSWISPINFYFSFSWLYPFVPFLILFCFFHS